MDRPNHFSHGYDLAIEGPLMQVVWFKRDLRIEDHLPLWSAVERAGADGVCCLYCHEPSLLGSKEWDLSHSRFIDDCLKELDQNLRSLGGHLTIRQGHICSVLARIHQQHRISELWSHQETGNKVTYDRDLAVGTWCRSAGVPWNEVPQHGIVRRLGNRDGWSRRWATRMKQPITPAPEAIRPAQVEAGPWLVPHTLVSSPSTVSSEQRGGTTAGLGTLEAFLNQRGQKYQTEMSSPVTAARACSRLSPHFAFGSLSIRQVHQRTEAAKTALKGRRDDEAKDWRKSYASFSKRLRWHCHFMQKLEDEPAIEFHNIHRGFDGLREGQFNEQLFDAWKAGQTGYPLIDACMRCVQQTGWLNFRMRAMVVSFASYHLWLHWRRPALWLAKHFLDYEPGIHFSQIQMQSGVTGMNTLRIYSPIKQVQDQDPEGHFIRQWVPELADLPQEHLAEPWETPPLVQQMYGIQIGSTYPQPLVDHKSAVAQARDLIYTRRRDPEVKALSKEVVLKHGSRRRPSKRRSA